MFKSGFQLWRSNNLSSLPTIDETMENTPVPDETSGDEIRNKDKTYLTNETEPTEVKDNEDDIAALVVASSNIRSSPKGRTSNAARKKSKHIRDVETSLSLLLPDNREAAEEKAFGFAQSYFMKVKEKLEETDSEHYQQFLEALYGFGSKINTVPELYKRISGILQSYPDLVSEFVVFLLPEQAMECGKLMEYLMLTKMNTFLRRLEVYFKRQPQQLRKIYTALTILSTQANVTMNEVRNAILPLLKGNSFLIESFLEIMPQEHLPDSIMTDFDEMGCVEFDSDNSAEDEHVETLIVPDEEDKYGSDTCICTCHNSTKQKYRSRIHHCVPCGTKFIHGKVFMQIGKILRPAKVLFPDGDMAACFERLLPKQCVKKSRKKGSAQCELSSVKETSPSKGAQNAAASQHRSSTHSDNSLAGKDVLKSKAVKQKAVNKNNKIREPTSAENGPVTHVTRSSRNSSLKVCIKAPKLSGADKTSNETASKKVSLKRPRSTSRSRVCQRPTEAGTKSSAVLDKETFSDTVSPSGSQEKGHDYQDSHASRQPAKKQCKSNDNLYTVALSLPDDNLPETFASSVAVDLFPNELQLPGQLSVVIKWVDNSQTAACTAVSNLRTADDQSALGGEVAVIHDNLYTNSLENNDDTVTNGSMDTELEQPEIKETAVTGGSSELISAPDNENLLVTAEDHPQAQECCNISEEVMDFQLENDTENDKNDMTPQLSSSGLKLEDAAGMSWTKEEDKVILKMFQQECATERILYMIRQQLPQRSVEQIQNRFQTLMNLLQKMTGVHMDDDQGI